MVIDRETLVSCIIAYHDTTKRRVGGELRDLLIAKLPRKQQPIVLAGHRIAPRKPPNRGVQTVTGKHQIVVA